MNTEYYKRVSSIVEPEVITSLRVIVVGQGSGGGMIAEDLGRLGVALLLIDLPEETLELHNVVRHALGQDSLGQRKHVAMAEHIRKINPHSQVQSVGLDVMAEGEAFQDQVVKFGPHLVIAATDNEESKFAIDRLARGIGVTVVGGGVYDGGVGGEVYVTEKGGPCYGCIARKIRGGKTPKKAPRSIDYSNPDLPEFRATAALKLDIAQIASLCVRVCLQRLVSPAEDAFGIPQGSNLVIYANRRIPGIFERPLAADFYRLASHPKCLVCGPAGVAPIQADSFAGVGFETGVPRDTFGPQTGGGSL